MPEAPSGGGASATASPIWAAPTSATIRPTGSFLSVSFEDLSPSIHRKPAQPGQNSLFPPLIAIAKRGELRSLSGQHTPTGREVWHKEDRAACSVRSRRPQISPPLPARGPRRAAPGARQAGGTSPKKN